MFAPKCLVLHDVLAILKNPSKLEAVATLSGRLFHKRIVERRIAGWTAHESKVPGSEGYDL